MAAVANTGATPVFADINRESFTIMVKGLEKKLTNLDTPLGPYASIKS